MNNTRDPIDVVCIQETWYKENDKPFNFKEYQKPIDKIRQNNAGGGLCIYVKKGVQFIEK